MRIVWPIGFAVPNSWVATVLPTTVILALLLPESSSKTLPCAAAQLRIWNHTAVVPITLLFQLASSEATWLRVCSIGATHLMLGISPFCSAAMSSHVYDKAAL